MSAVTMYGYLRPHCAVKAHEVAAATNAELAGALWWTTNDWRDDPEWPCAAIGSLTIERVPPADFAAAQVELLRKKKTAVMAASQAAVTEIDRQINSLLAITMDAAES